jgi:tetratricopeptide (TPR) repeat protein
MPAAARYLEPNDPAYRAALGHLQKGQWEPGLKGLKGLTERFPHDTDLRALLEENQVRAKIDQDERSDRRRALLGLVALWAARLVVIAALAYGAWWGVQSYSVWFQQQAVIAQEAMAAQARAVDLATKYADAQSMLRAGRLDETQALLDQIVELDPHYPGVDTLQAQVKSLKALETQYEQAVDLVNKGRWAEALAALQAIANAQPGYKNVAELVALVQQQMMLDDLWTKAQASYDAKNWGDAASIYERMRAISKDYRNSQVVDRLFECYVNAGRAAMAGQEDSLTAIQRAESYFGRALALRPQDPSVKTDGDLARLYLLAQQDFTDGRYSNVVDSLQVVYGASPDYAKGVARQTLYEAYMARGSASMDSQQYDSALSDFQAAVALASKDDQATFALYQAYERAGDAYVKQKDLESAVLMYRKAVDAGQLAQRAKAGLSSALQEADDAVSKNNLSLASEKYQAVFQQAIQSQASLTYAVQPGDYLVLVATRYHSTVAAIVQANKLQGSTLLQAGQSLVIPITP